MSEDLSDFFDELGLMELFSTEMESLSGVLNNGLLALERDPSDSSGIEELMRAAHSVKGAARIAQLDSIVELAHAMEDYFVAVQEGKADVAAEHVDVLLAGVDTMEKLSKVATDQFNQWLESQQSGIAEQVSAVKLLISTEAGARPLPPSAPQPLAEPTVPAPQEPAPSTTAEAVDAKEARDRVVRLTSDSLDRLMSLAGEVRVDTLWLRPYADSLLQLKSSQASLANILENLRRKAAEGSALASISDIDEAQQKIEDCRSLLADRMDTLETFARRTADLSSRLYREVINSRMRPFSDGGQGLNRLVRDTARSLGKMVRLETVGEDTDVDRDILEKLEAPLTHLVRNALDHGIEFPAERIAASKPEEGVIRLEARHSAGMLSIVISDDGSGIDVTSIRAVVVERGLTDENTAQRLSDTELLEFLFLPGFSTATQVTEISGRGVGMDVVQSMVQEVGGIIHSTTQLGSGTSFHMQLPLTLSVTRTLMMQIGDEPYALPIARVDRTLVLPHDRIEMLEGKEYVMYEGRRIGLVSARQVLEIGAGHSNSALLHIVVLSDRLNTYGLVVDAFLGEHDLVVRPLDPRLGKVQDVSSAAFTEEGAPILVLDSDDLVRSIDSLISGDRIRKVAYDSGEAVDTQHKRVLVVDDSITVREVERKLLENWGYEVDVAVDGVDGWNAARQKTYDLVISDVDMPKMTGIELVRNIKRDPELKSVPVMIVSYKDREEDRLQGLEAGANYYLTKSSFRDETLLDAVRELIGDA